jgi:DNA-binding PadR family transcriptional regulator
MKKEGSITKQYVMKMPNVTRTLKALLKHGFVEGIGSDHRTFELTDMGKQLAELTPRFSGYGFTNEGHPSDSWTVIVENGTVSNPKNPKKELRKDFRKTFPVTDTRTLEETQNEKEGKFGSKLLNVIDNRELGKSGIYRIDKAYKPKVDDNIDYYDRVGDKRYGTILEITDKGMSVQDSQSKKVVKLKFGAFKKANGFENILGQVKDFAESLVTGGTLITYEKFKESSNLDPRSYVKMWVLRDVLITSAGNALPYYGGFEYVGKEHKTTVGDYVIYSNEDSRVNELINNLLGNVGDEDED